MAKKSASFRIGKVQAYLGGQVWFLFCQATNGRNLCLARKFLNLLGGVK